MIRFDLKGAMNEYESRTGIRLSYADLSRLSGVSIDTLKSLANRKSYNATLQIIWELSSSIGVDPIKHIVKDTDHSIDEGRA